VALLTRAIDRKRPCNRILNRARNRCAFTLAEALIASVVLAIAALSIATALSACAQQSTAFDSDATALSLARELIEAVAARPFDPPGSGDQPGWGAGSQTCDNYDDISDFAGYTDTVAADQASSDGRTAHSVSYHRTTTIGYRATPTGADQASVSPSTGFAMVTVTVQPADGQRPAVTLTRLVTRVTRG
jgi:Tfp pilus assembly protein PilV